ncbi:putative dfg5 protein [Xylariales sp. PMI_506]|nr:putative dfg5 protein [Xylariales sp. PMI_506]
MWHPNICRLLGFLPVALAALDVDLDSSDSIINAASQVAYDLMSYYQGNQSGQIPGILPGPPPSGDYYWWEGGALWGAMVDYWHFTGDDSYNDVVTQSLLFQVGPAWDYMPPNWTASLGNDDQGFWGMSALLAAEVNFPNPPSDQPQWLALAQAVWNEQTESTRRDNESCGIGLRWQIFPENNGYNYKNSIANGIFLNMGARLARYTANDTYAQWASKTWDWLIDYGLIDDNYNVYDGIQVTNCSDINPVQYSYNAAVITQGVAYMYNYTDGDDVWKTRLDGLLNRTLDVFFSKGIAYEIACETPPSVCTADMYSFKGYDHRWLASTTQMAPYTLDTIMPILKTSTQAAVNQCTGGDNGRLCGFHWSTGKYDGTPGAGQEMDVLGALSSLLITTASIPYTNTTGGTSVGNPNAGSSTSTDLNPLSPINTGDKAGAAIVTIIMLVGGLVFYVWMGMDEGSFSQAGRIFGLNRKQ